MTEWLVGLGLFVNMAGVAMAFFVGFPQPSHRGDALLLENSPSSAALTQSRQRRRRLSYVGLALMFVGFALQFLGLVVDDSEPSSAEAGFVEASELGSGWRQADQIGHLSFQACSDTLPARQGETHSEVGALVDEDGRLLLQQERLEYSDEAAAAGAVAKFRKAVSSCRTFDRQDDDGLARVRVAELDIEGAAAAQFSVEFPDDTGQAFVAIARRSGLSVAYVTVDAIQGGSPQRAVVKAVAAALRYRPMQNSREVPLPPPRRVVTAGPSRDHTNITGDRR